MSMNYKCRKWQRRAKTIACKMDDLMTDIHEHVAPSTALELSVVNHSARLVDELDMLVCNLHSLAAQATFKGQSR